VIKSKAFLISQALKDAKVDVATSGLGLDGFKKLLKSSQKDRSDEKSGKHETRNHLKREYGFRLY
jgi:hypothetical protein